MSDFVPANDVIRVLRAHKVFVALEDDKTQLYTIERGDFMESVVLDGDIGKRYLQRLKVKLNIPIHHFWNPEEAEAEQTGD